MTNDEKLEAFRTMKHEMNAFRCAAAFRAVADAVEARPASKLILGALCIEIAKRLKGDVPRGLPIAAIFAAVSDAYLKSVDAEECLRWDA